MTAVSFPAEREILTPRFLSNGVVFLMQGKAEICGVNTAQLPVLKSAETRALLEKARGGDKRAREKRHRRNTDSLGICSRRQDRRLPERSLFP